MVLRAICIDSDLKVCYNANGVLFGRIAVRRLSAHFHYAPIASIFARLFEQVEI